MIFTEKEAALKRCTPSVVIWLLDKERRDALQAGGAQVADNCLGSKCAQWCWFDYANELGITHFPIGNGNTSFTKGRRDPGKTEVQYVAAPARGYCGLTGTRE